VRASSDRSAASAGNDQYQAYNERNDAKRPHDGDPGQKADDQQYYPEDNHLSSPFAAFACQGTVDRDS
jgi:hypothetical protein